MLKSVRYGADRVLVRNVHWLHALVAATIIVSFAPSISRAATSTAYDTDIVEPLIASGRLTFSAEASDEQLISTANSAGFAIWCGASRPKVNAAAANTAPTKSRAAMGRSFITPAGGDRAVKMPPRNRNQPTDSRLLRPAGRASGSS